MKIYLALAGSALIIGSISPAGATLLNLNPGECYGTSSNCTGLTIIPTPANLPIQNNVLNLAGPNLVADTGIRTATGIGPSSMFVDAFREIVYRTAAGTLDFYYQFGVTGPTAASHTNWLITNGYAGWSTSVAYDTDSSSFLVPPPTVPPYEAPTGATRSTDGNTITFKFAPPNTPYQGMNVYTLLISTNATAFQLSDTLLMNGGTADILNTFAPGPEPGSIVLFGTVLATLGFVFRRRVAKS
jgi:hypothetical protein